MIQKIIFRDQVKEYLLKRIMKGDIKPGELISLARFGRDLDVSVTPIREALSQLQQAGVVTAIPNRGFQITPLSIEEAREIYPIIGHLEGLAVSLCSFTKHHLKKLELLQGAFGAASSTAEAVKADDTFHSTLFRNCKNQTLIRMIGDLKVRIFLYELEFMGSGELTAQSFKQHQQIIAKLQQGQTTEAVSLIHQHWNSSLQFINTSFDEKL